MKKNSLIKGILLVTIIAISMLITSNAYAAETIVLTQNSRITQAVCQILSQHHAAGDRGGSAGAGADPCGGQPGLQRRGGPGHPPDRKSVV